MSELIQADQIMSGAIRVEQIAPLIMVVSFGTAEKGFSIFLSNCLSQLLLINKGSLSPSICYNIEVINNINIEFIVIVFNRT